jgi:hypothetical protein
MQQGIVLLKEYAQTWNESKHLTGQLLIALCNLTLEETSDDKGYISTELAEGVSKIRGRQWLDLTDADACSDRVRRYWKQLIELWETKKDGIQQYLNDRGIHALPRLEKIEGGGAGHQSRYFIAWSDQPQSEQYPPTVDAYAPYQLKYVCEDISNAGFVARLFAKGMDVSGWRRYVFASWISVLIIIGVFGIFILLGQVLLWDSYGIEQIFRTFVGISLLILGIWFYFGSFIFLPDKRITVAPFWLQSEFNDRLIELRSQPVRTLKAVHYSSTCPICQGKVNAMSGKWEFRGRIVGRCENAPVEHVFSFDHVTRSGRSLRKLV